MAHILIEQGGGETSRVELSQDVFTIGRGTANDLHFRNPWLSRLHARIVLRGSAHYLADAGSRNGTYLNGRALTGEAPLADGDVIALGDVLLRFADTTTRSAPSSLRVADSKDPLPAGNTVLLSHDELEFDRYREPSSTAAGAVVAVGEAAASLLPALTRAASTLINHYPLPELLEQVIDLTLDTVTAERGALLLKEHGELEVKTVRGYDGDDVAISRTLIEEVLDKSQAVLTLDAQSDDRFENADSILLAGIRSIICVPLWNNREVIGLLYLDQRFEGESFSENDLRVTGLIANLAAVKIENVRLLEEQLEKKRMETQLRLASEIQRALLPAADPLLPGYEICGENLSCYEIGGDYYNFIAKRDGKLAVVIGDISGKGVGAALLMAVLQASLRALVHTAAEPAVLVGQLNEVLVDSSPENKFSTLFYAELDPETHELEYVNGGHNPALLAAGGEVEELGSTGPLVGLLEEARFQSRRVRLAAGGVFLLYTDGISEPENKAGEEFGTERLAEILRHRPSASGRELIATIRRRLEEFQAGAEGLDDDSTLVVVRRLR